MILVQPRKQALPRKQAPHYWPVLTKEVLQMMLVLPKI
jgi:hypothetical protein